MKKDCIYRKDKGDEFKWYDGGDKLNKGYEVDVWRTDEREEKKSRKEDLNNKVAALLHL